MRISFPIKLFYYIVNEMRDTIAYNIQSRHTEPFLFFPINNQDRVALSYLSVFNNNCRLIFEIK